MTEPKLPIVIPENYYDAIITEVSAEETKNSKENGLHNGFYLKIKLNITSENQFNDSLYFYFNFINPNPQAVELSKKAWEKLLIALEVPHFEFPAFPVLDNKELRKILYKSCRIKVGIRQDTTYNVLRNVVKGFYPFLKQSGAPKPTPNTPPHPNQSNLNSPSWTTETTPLDDDIPF